jgi:queuine tRNA-ribosyltransferase
MFLGVVQGSTFPDLRGRSAEEVSRLDIDGFAIGGVSVGEPQEAMLQAVDTSTATLPADRFTHLLGVGHLDDIVHSVALGVDTFDCVMPTRVARNGRAITLTGRINLRNAEHAEDRRPIDASCPCYACRHFSRGALRHWLKSGEIAPLTLLTIHNLYVISDLMRKIRASLAAGTFGEFCQRFLAEREPEPDRSASVAGGMAQA